MFVYHNVYTFLYSFAQETFHPPPYPFTLSVRSMEVTPHGDQTGEHSGQEFIVATAIPSWSYGTTKLELQQYQVGATAIPSWKHQVP